MSADGMIDKYPEVWETLKFHNFQMVTKPWDPYVPTLVHESYEAYYKVIRKNIRRAKSMLKPLDTVEVQGVQVLYSQTDINDIL